MRRVIPTVLLLLAALPAFAEYEAQTVHGGYVALSVSNCGIVGNAFDDRNEPSCEYPAYTGGEHLFLAGLWVGAVDAAGRRLVSTAAQDANSLAAALEVAEFAAFSGQPPGVFRLMSNVVTSPEYDPAALAPTHLESEFHDDVALESGGHRPLGLKITLRALAWNTPHYDDFVILDYTVENVSGGDLSDVHVGFWNDTTVGNTNVNNPYDPMAPSRWNYYDDLNGAWRPGDFTTDPTLWMMHEHDDDGDGGWAESWVGCRLLGSDPQPAPRPGLPPVSYNCWRYRGGPEEDDWYHEPGDPTTLLPGRYQFMSNGHFDVGVTPDGDFTTASNRVGLLATGPFPHLGDGETIRVVFALVLGRDGYHLRSHSRLAKLLYDHGYQVQVAAAGDAGSPPVRLRAAAPNPFNPVTSLVFDLARGGEVALAVYDPAGRLVRTLETGRRPAGMHEVIWNGRADDGRILPSGTYIVRLEADGRSQSRRVTLLK